MQVDIRKYFTPAAVASHLEALPELKTPIIDLVYSTRPTHPLPVLGIDELAGVVSNVPVVRRGTAAYPLTGEGKKITYLEPQPVDVSSFLSAVDLNNLKLLDNRGVEQWARNKVDTQRRAVRATTEAMACQSLTGKISYPMKTASGITTHDVDFGATLSYTIATKWDAAGADIVTVLDDLIAMRTLMQSKSGYGSRLAVLAGKKAFLAVARKALAVVADKNMGVAVSDEGISMPGFTIALASGGYLDLLNNNAFVPAVEDNAVVMVALDAPFRLFYCALDDLDANLLPMPFYSKPIKVDNPSGYNIIGMSKPVPVPVVNAICKGTATA